MKRKALILIIVGLLILASLPVQAADDTTITVGLSLPADTGIVYENIIEGAQLAAEDSAVTLALTTANNDVETELANVQDLIDQGVDVIVLAPTDTTASVDAVLAANEAGIPVFLIGDMLPGDVELEIAGTFMPDATTAGTLGAETVCNIDEAATILELTGYVDEGDSAMDLSTAFNAGLADLCPDATTQTLDVVGMDRDAVFEAVTTALDENDAITLIFGFDDTSTLAAVDAAFRRNVQVVGVGTSEELVDNVEKIDHLVAVITPDAFGLGQATVNAPLMYLSGEDVLESLDISLSVLDLESMSNFRCPPLARNC